MDLLDARFVEPGLVNKLYARGLFDGLIEWMDASIRNNEDLLMNFYLFRNAEKLIPESLLHESIFSAAWLASSTTP